MPKPSAPASIGFRTSCGLVIANIIGTGIFTSLGFQVADIHAGFSLLMLWIIGGILALCGALCYGELSATLPRSGGEYHFLSAIYHPALGFMAGFISATVGFSAPIALAAMAFGRYAQGTMGRGSPVLLSFVLVWIVTLVHLRGTKTGSVFQDFFTLVKIILIATLIGGGLLVEPKQPISFLPGPGNAQEILSPAFAVALVYVMYAYSGWNAASYITDEIVRPEKTVPRALFCGTIVVLLLYTLINAVFLATTPVREITGQIEVALIAGKHIFGEQGGRVVGGIICLGLISAVSSMTWIGPRVTKSMGEDHRFLSFFARTTAGGIPAAALLMQLFIVNLLLFSGSFERVVIYIQFSLLLCSFLTVAGLIVLRMRKPGLARPYRVFAYPIPPLLFCVVTAWMMVYLLRTHPTESFFGVGTMLAGLILYFVGRSATPSTA